MIKKILIFFCTAALTLTALTACGGQKEEQEQKKPETAETQEKQKPEEEQKLEEAKETEKNLSGHTLMIYCGAGMQKPFQEIADAFKAETKCEIDVTFANAGQIQSQITTSEEGDMFVAGSAEELKPIQDYVVSQKDLVKHIPVLAVAEGNPKEITGLESLAKEGVTMIMGDEKTTPIGKIAKKALSEAGILDQVTILANTTTAPQMATVVQNKEADVAIIWKENCNADGVEIVDTTDLDAYIKTIPAASLSCSADKEALDAFNDYLGSDAAKEIWSKYGYENIG